MSRLRKTRFAQELGSLGIVLLVVGENPIKTAQAITLPRCAFGQNAGDRTEVVCEQFRCLVEISWIQPPASWNSHISLLFATPCCSLSPLYLRRYANELLLFGKEGLTIPF